MDNAMMLFGYLVIALIGFVVPVLGLLLSIYQGGIDKLKIKYENQKAESEKAKQDFLSGVISGNVLHKGDLKQIKAQLREMEKAELKIKKEVNFKLEFLDIKTAAVRFAGPMMASMLAVMLYYILPGAWKAAAITSSIVLFAYSVFILVKLLDVVVEMTRLADRESKDMNARLIEALAEGPEHSGGMDLKVSINGKKPGEMLSMSVGEKREFKLEMENPGRTIARNAALTVTVPEGFEVEHKPYYSVTRNGAGYGVMYTADFIHPGTSFLCGPLVIKALKERKDEVTCMINADNHAKEASYKYTINASRSLEDMIEKALGIE